MVDGIVSPTMPHIFEGSLQSVTSQEALHKHPHLPTSCDRTTFSGIRPSEDQFIDDMTVGREDDEEAFKN